MRRSLSVVARLVIMTAAIALSGSRAEAVTLREIIELTRAGLSDDVLLALIEVDARVFPIDPDTLKSLKEAGVSPAVIIAIIKSGRAPQPQPDPVLEIQPPDPPPPQVVVVERPVVHEVAVAVPVYVGVGTVTHRRRRELPYVATGTSLPPLGFLSASPAARPEPPRRAEPVYWGWGGKLRPDAWQPADGPTDRGRAPRK